MRRISEGNHINLCSEGHLLTASVVRVLPQETGSYLQ
jgi:hypothetical protein